MSDVVPIWFDTFHIGDIEVAPSGELSFQYDRLWRGANGAFPISVTMPLSDTRYGSEIISPWIANLLPEEDQLLAISTTLGLDRSDALAILKEIGGDTAGALSFGERSDPRRWAYTTLTELYKVDDPQDALEKHFTDLGQRPFLAGEDGVRQSLAGGQKKSALAVLSPEGKPVLRLPQPGDQLAVPRDGAPSTIILKPDNDFLPGITENEVFCLRLARAIGLPTAEATILDTGSRSAICVLRYDRQVGETGRLYRLHQEDFAQANGIPPGRKYESGTLPGLDLKTLLGTARALNPGDTLALQDQLIFNILVANTDAHAKNYSILHPLHRKPALAPLYDVSTVLSWPWISQTYAQKLAGKKRKPGAMDARHWDTIAASAGARPTELRRRVLDLVDAIVTHRVPVTQEVASLQGADEGYVKQAAQAIEENALRIAGRLRKVTGPPPPGEK